MFTFSSLTLSRCPRFPTQVSRVCRAPRPLPGLYLRGPSRDRARPPSPSGTVNDQAPGRPLPVCPGLAWAGTKPHPTFSAFSLRGHAAGNLKPAELKSEPPVGPKAGWAHPGRRGAHVSQWGPHLHASPRPAAAATPEPHSPVHVGNRRAELARARRQPGPHPHPH